jgi:dTDP-4-dehydrorhamnose 3,5-epimerase
MKKIDCKLPEVYIIEPQVFGDHRGWFMETWSEAKYKELGINKRFVQDNHSYTAKKGTLRGLHFQNNPMAQCKIVRCIAGAVMDVAVFILNGDTYFDVDLNEMKVFHEKNQSKLTVAVKELSNFDRYGSVVIENDMIKRFVEKKPTDQGKINGGIYRLQKEVLNSVNKELFSFEKVILESGIVDIYAFRSDRYFIDIGVPEDYYKAQGDFLNFELDVKRRL